MSIDSLSEQLLIKTSSLEGREGVLPVPELIYQPNFAYTAGYSLDEDAIVFGRNLLDKWSQSEGGKVWVKGAMRHESSHYLMAHLSDGNQAEVLKLMTSEGNLVLLRDFYRVMRGVGTGYSVKYFSPSGPITRAFLNRRKVLGRGYHEIEEIDFDFNGKTERVNLNLVVDEFLAFMSVTLGSDVIVTGAEFITVTGKARALFEKIDPATKDRLEEIGFTNLDIWILWARVEQYLNNPERLHEIERPIVIKEEDILQCPSFGGR